MRMLADVFAQMPILPFFPLAHKSNINETGKKNRVNFDIINDEIYGCALNSNDRSIQKV